MSSEKDLGIMPHWELSNIYPSLESSEFEDAVKDLSTRIKKLDQFLDKEQISREGEIPSSIEGIAVIVSEYLQMTNDILALAGTIGAFLYGYISTDSFNTLAKRKESEFERITVQIHKQEVLFKGWLGEVVKQGADLGGLIAANPAAQDHDFFLQETVEQSKYLMSDEGEALASELSLSGGSAWQKLQGTVTSQISVPFEREGVIEDIPIAELQNICSYDPDEQTRRRAFEAEIKAWESMRESLAACMNGVKGTVLTLDAPARPTRPESEPGHEHTEHQGSGTRRGTELQQQAATPRHLVRKSDGAGEEEEQPQPQRMDAGAGR